MVVAKLDSAGILQWATTLIPAETGSEAHSIRQTVDGGYILTGSVGISYPDQPAVCLIRLTPQGEVNWAKKLTFDTPIITSAGCDAVETAEGFLCYATGYYSGIFLIRTDSTGNFLHSNFISDYGGFSDWLSQSLMPKLHATPSGDFLFVAMGQWGHLYKADSLGNGLWSRTLWLEVVDVIPTYDLGSLVVGNGPLWGVSDPNEYNLQIGMIKTDSSGNEENCVWESAIQSEEITAHFDSLVLDTTFGATLSTLTAILTNDNLSDYESCVALTPGIDETLSDGKLLLTVSPNPSSGIIRISMEPVMTGTISLEIYSTTGQLVFLSASDLSLPVQVNISSFPDGLYLIRGYFDGKSLTGRILIQH